MKIQGTILTETRETIEIECEIKRVLKSAEGDWACEIDMTMPIRKKIQIYGLDENGAIQNALKFVADMIK
jgi:hypothetical protein